MILIFLQISISWLFDSFLLLSFRNSNQSNNFFQLGFYSYVIYKWFYFISFILLNLNQNDYWSKKTRFSNEEFFGKPLLYLFRIYSFIFVSKNEKIHLNLFSLIRKILNQKKNVQEKILLNKLRGFFDWQFFSLLLFYALFMVHYMCWLIKITSFCNK